MAAEAPRVWVTRPAERADELCRLLSAAGCRVVQQPLLEIQMPDSLPAEQRTMLLELDRYQHVIFVSLSAIEHGMTQIENYWPQLPVGIHWYTVGAASAHRLSQWGLDVLQPVDAMTSEGLLALPSLVNPRDERVLLVRGEGGRTLLADTLVERGALVDELACYRRAAPSLESGELDARVGLSTLDAILITSAEGLANLVRLLTPEETNNVSSKMLVVPSSRVARHARESGFTRIVTADNATDLAMLAALQGALADPETTT